MGSVIGYLNRESTMVAHSRVTWMLLGVMVGADCLADQPPNVWFPPQPAEIARTDQGRSTGRSRDAIHASVRRLPPVHPVTRPSMRELRKQQADRVGTQSSLSPSHVANSAIATRDSIGSTTRPLGVMSGPVPAGGHASVRDAEGRRQLETAYLDLRRGALASAEAAAWNAIEAFSDTADLQLASRSAETTSTRMTFRQSVATARVAMNEARDFSPVLLREIDLLPVRRRSHQTVVAQNPMANELPPANEPSAWIDLYLDQARRALIPLATESVDAAEAMDVLASIVLQRNRPGSIAMATSLCLRRAALAGQPQNTSLAMALSQQLTDAGLRREAFGVRHYAAAVNARRGDVALSQSMEQPSPTNGVIQIDRVEPSEFAAISKDVLSAVPGSTSSPDIQRNFATRNSDSTSRTTPTLSLVTHANEGTVTAAGYRAAATKNAAAAISGNAVRPPSVDDATAVDAPKSRLQSLRNLLSSGLFGGRDD